MTQVPPADSLRAVLDSVFAAPKYDWVPRADAWSWVRQQFGRLLDWLGLLEVNSPVAYWLVIFALLTVLVAILVHGGFIMARAMRYATAPDHRGAVRVAERRDAAWFRARASRLADEGRYREAVRATFEAVVLDLDAAGRVRWHPSKTPREYVRESTLEPARRGRLGSLVDGVYAFSFAGEPCGRPEWEAWRAEAREVTGV